MKVFAALCLFALSASTACAQKLPEAPKPTLDLVLFAAQVAARSLDVVSTDHLLGQRGEYEYELPPWIVNRTGSLVAFEATVIGAEMIGERILRHHGHPRLARMVPALDATAVSITVAMNFRLRPAPVQAALTGTPASGRPQ